MCIGIGAAGEWSNTAKFLGTLSPTSPSYLQSAEKLTEAAVPRKESVSTDSMHACSTPSSHSQSPGETTETPVSRSKKELLVSAIKLGAIVSLICLYPKLALDVLLVTLAVVHSTFVLAVWANQKEIATCIARNRKPLHSDPQVYNIIERQLVNWMKSISGNLQNIFKLS